MTEPKIYPEAYDVCAYWMVRKETPEECAERALKLIEGLGRLDPRFTGFMRSARVRGKRVEVPLELEKTALAALFARGVNRDEINRAPIEDLGFSLWVTSGGKGRPGAGLRMNWGIYTDAVCNACVVHWDRIVGPEPLLEVPMLKRIVDCLVEALDPDWVVAGSNQHREAVNESEKGTWPVGWLNYISVRQGRVPPLSAPVQIERMGDKGTLVLLTPERITATNPEHVAIGRRVRDLLDRSGVLKRREGGPDAP